MDILLSDGTERASKNGRQESPFAVCASCLRGHRKQCKHPLTCGCVCRSVQIVTQDEVALLNGRWEKKLAAYVKEMEREVRDREIVAGAEKALGAAA